MFNKKFKLQEGGKIDIVSVEAINKVSNTVQIQKFDIWCALKWH